MTQEQHTYTPPDTTAGDHVPAAVAGYLDGEDLLAKTQAVRLSTVDADGWPRAALLSAGDTLMLAVDGSASPSSRSPAPPPISTATHVSP